MPALLSEQITKEDIRELGDELKDLNKTTKKSIKITEKLTIVLIAVAIIQFIVSLFQFLFTIGTSKYVWLGLVIEILMFGFIYKTLKDLYSYYRKDNKDND